MNNKVGRPATGVKRKSICISGQPEQIEELKALAVNENKTVSRFIFERCGVHMNAKNFNNIHAAENGKDSSVYWGMQNYFLYAMKDGYIMSYTTGSNKTVEDEIKSKGRTDFTFWLVEKDGEVAFYKYKGESVILDKVVKGKILKDKEIELNNGVIGGGVITSFINYKLIINTDK